MLIFAAWVGAWTPPKRQKQKHPPKQQNINTPQPLPPSLHGRIRFSARNTLPPKQRCLGREHVFLLLFVRVGAFTVWPGGVGGMIFCCLGGEVCMFFAVWAGVVSSFFAVWADGRVDFFAVWAGGGMFFLLFGRRGVYFFCCLGGVGSCCFRSLGGGGGTGVHSLAGLPGSSLMGSTTKKTTQQ